MMMGGFWGVRNEVWVFRRVAGGCVALRGASSIGIHCGCVRVVVGCQEGKEIKRKEKKAWCNVFFGFYHTRCVITLRSRAFSNLHLHPPRTLSSSSHLALPTYYLPIIPTYLNSTQTPPAIHATGAYYPTLLLLFS